MENAPLDRLAVSLAARTTRRTSFGLFAALGLLMADPIGEEIAAKGRKKRRKKRKKGENDQTDDPGNERCLRLDEQCVRGRDPRCCGGLTCDQTIAAEVAGTFCCQPEGTPCTSYEGCCSGVCDFLVGGGTCAPCRGRSCNAERPCCGGLDCENGYCGGCRDRAVFCTSSADCCYSDCTGGACLSTQGGKCARDVDCRSCYLNRECDGACVNGACAF